MDSFLQKSFLPASRWLHLKDAVRNHLPAQHMKIPDYIIKQKKPCTTHGN